MIKYPRTLHLPWSQGITSDDKVCKSLKHFEGRRVVVTEKMDGENITLYRDCIHARSLDSKGGVERDWVKQFWSSFKHEIPENWRICGENLWARHSISYDNLISYFYGFSVWDEKNYALSWKDTLEVFNALNITPVPVLYEGIFDELTIKKLTNNLDLEKSEGYVVRLEESFSYNDFSTSVAKFVRAQHVQTDKHWKSQTFIPNTLIS